MRVVIAFDPGLTIGCCAFVQRETSMELVQSLHLHSIDAIVAYLDDIESRYLRREIAVVAESFARGNSVVDEQIKTLRMCGAIEALCSHYGIRWSEQYPASRAGYVPVAKCMIRELGFGTLQQNHHAIDAIAHALCFMDKEGLEWKKQYWLRQVIQKS